MCFVTSLDAVIPFATLTPLGYGSKDNSRYREGAQMNEGLYVVVLLDSDRNINRGSWTLLTVSFGVL